MPKTGFTLIEVLLVLALLSIMGGLGLAAGLNNYRSSVFAEDIRLIDTQLRQARLQAMRDSPGDHRVIIENHHFITKDQDFDTQLTLEGQSSVELSFQSLSGNLIDPRTFTFTNGPNSTTFIINSEGAIIQ